ncbi:PREDICTED: LOW QUALITY PROTEIN: uncharacterized protein LOC104617086 [Phaethon lepturus]|uniref:LOW QUALITY PROTEIN: uncharacterized protein LOC104617086 n=1 Tax=Phaethon lepturus TaxID=97097 RepID=UPI000530A623|nr:PREDICTED: LOW QUALITY PROTEIN: uncharacterized protein LOC104617086 [Phaethon lepturus]
MAGCLAMADTGFPERGRLRYLPVSQPCCALAQGLLFSSCSTLAPCLLPPHQGKGLSSPSPRCHLGRILPSPNTKDALCTTLRFSSVGSLPTCGRPRRSSADRSSARGRGPLPVCDGRQMRAPAATCAALSPAGSCFWVAVLDGNVVGIVAARGNEEDNTVELRRMSVDSNYRGKGIAKALGRKVLEFAMLNNYSSVVLGTTAVKMAAHKLYESLGFKHVGVVEHYALPGMTRSLLERMFFQLRYHRYRLQLREE